MQKIRLNNLQIDISYDVSEITFNNKYVDMRNVSNINVKYDSGEFIINLDSRSNDISFEYSPNSFGGSYNTITNAKNDNQHYVFKLENKIKEAFNKLKDSDFRYKVGDGYEGTKKIDAETFISFLKSEDRNITLEKILS